MYEWKFDEKTDGIFTGRHDMFGVEIYEGNRVETPLGSGIVRYNPKYWRFEIAEENEPLDNVREDAGIPEECWVVIDVGHWTCPVGEKGKKETNGGYYE